MENLKEIIDAVTKGVDALFFEKFGLDLLTMANQFPDYAFGTPEPDDEFIGVMNLEERQLYVLYESLGMVTRRMCLVDSLLGGDVNITDQEWVDLNFAKSLVALTLARKMMHHKGLNHGHFAVLKGFVIVNRSERYQRAQKVVEALEQVGQLAMLSTLTELFDGLDEEEEWPEELDEFEEGRERY